MFELPAVRVDNGRAGPVVQSERELPAGSSVATHQLSLPCLHGLRGAARPDGRAACAARRSADPCA